MKKTCFWRRLVFSQSPTTTKAANANICEKCSMRARLSTVRSTYSQDATATRSFWNNSNCRWNRPSSSLSIRWCQHPKKELIRSYLPRIVLGQCLLTWTSQRCRLSRCHSMLLSTTARLWRTLCAVRTQQPSLTCQMSSISRRRPRLLSASGIRAITPTKSSKSPTRMCGASVMRYPNYACSLLSSKCKWGRLKTVGRPSKDVRCKTSREDSLKSLVQNQSLTNNSTATLLMRLTRQLTWLAHLQPARK